MRKFELLPPNPWLESLKNWEKLLKSVIYEKTVAVEAGKLAARKEIAGTKNAPAGQATTEAGKLATWKEIAETKNAPAGQATVEAGKLAARKEIAETGKLAAGQATTGAGNTPAGQAFTVPGKLAAKQAIPVPENTPTAHPAKLRITKNKGTYQYYEVTEKSPKNGKYISKKQISQIKQIAQQEYDIKIIDKLKKELLLVQKFLSSYQKQNAATTYEKLPSARRALVTPLSLPDPDYARVWQQIEYHHKPFATATANNSSSIPAPEYYTQKGERVRSKSEILIANTLAQYKIPYRYEYPVRLQSFTAHPDFFCLNPRTRREYLWEHLGRMDDLSYLSENLPRLLLYEKSGYFPGHHLILTFETAALPLSVNQIKNVINEYLT